MSRSAQKSASAVRQRGVTLVELMIVVAAVAILAAISYPSYREHALKAARAEGRGALMNASARLEQFYLDNKTYTTNLASVNVAATTEHGNYQIAIAACAGGTIATCYALTATPQGGQVKDTKCANLTLNSSGVRGASGSAPTTCW